MITQSKVDMVNRCLMAIGEVPIDDYTVLDTVQPGTDIDVARRMVESTLREVLTRGWYFNMDYDFKLIPDPNDGFITLPPNVLRMDTQDSNQYILRNGKVYDVYNHTYVIKETFEADLIYDVAIEELPVPAYEYIANRSARKFQERVIGDPNMTAITMQDELDSYNDLMRIQLQTQGYTMSKGSRISNWHLKQGLYFNRGRR